MAYGGVGVRAGPAVALSRERAKCPPAAGGGDVLRQLELRRAGAGLL